MTTRVLLVGESWTTSETHYKGFDQFGSVRFHAEVAGADDFAAAGVRFGFEGPDTPL